MFLLFRISCRAQVHFPLLAAEFPAAVIHTPSFTDGSSAGLQGGVAVLNAARRGHSPPRLPIITFLIRRGTATPPCIRLHRFGCLGQIPIKHPGPGWSDGLPCGVDRGWKYEVSTHVMASYLPYKISVLVFLENKAGEHLLILRSQSPNFGHWSPIGGKLEMNVGESPFECAVRETCEETGLRITGDDLHLFAMIAEKAYEGESHWLMFLFRCRRPIEASPARHLRGPFRVFQPGGDRGSAHPGDGSRGIMAGLRPLPRPFCGAARRLRPRSSRAGNHRGGNPAGGLTVLRSGGCRKRQPALDKFPPMSIITCNLQMMFHS